MEGGVALTRQGKLIISGVVLVPLLGFGLLYVHWFVYPFVSVKPNFADIEAVYNKLDIPSDWVLIEESENRGIAGRQCPVESATYCFHISSNYSTSSAVTKEDVRSVVLSSGCVSAFERDESQRGNEKISYTYICTSGGIRILGSWTDENGGVTTGVGVRSE